MDGTCDGENVCLGLLAPASYHTKAFVPGFAFSLTTTGWENLADESGDIALLSTTTPGDGIFFFGRPRATKPDGTHDPDGGSTVQSLTTWLSGNATLTVAQTMPVSVGGLTGTRLDVAVAPGYKNHPADCPVQVCLALFKGSDLLAKPPWHWDWGFAGPERQRFYLLSTGDDMVLIAVDSLDGTTFDSLTKAADEILATVNFDKP